MLTNSYIYIRKLRFHAFHGVEAQERLTGNDYELSLRMQVDVSKAMTSDDVADTVNYAEVYALAKQEMATASNLLEHVAGRIGQAIISRWPAIRMVEVDLVKLNPPMGGECRGAGVYLHLINDKTVSP
ncbi:dihydroneopterin aldolase [Hallella bergensis]|uniref:dihydroneopterin aldolase n=1 Tax=Hallella bergensis TaxID=242750 RepID=UPI003990868A